MVVSAVAFESAVAPPVIAVSAVGVSVVVTPLVIVVW